MTSRIASCLSLRLLRRRVCRLLAAASSSLDAPVSCLARCGIGRPNVGGPWWCVRHSKLYPADARARQTFVRVCREFVARSRRIGMLAAFEHSKIYSEQSFASGPPGRGPDAKLSRRCEHERSDRHRRRFSTPARTRPREAAPRRRRVCASPVAVASCSPRSPPSRSWSARSCFAAQRRRRRGRRRRRRRRRLVRVRHGRSRASRSGRIAETIAPDRRPARRRRRRSSGSTRSTTRRRRARASASRIPAQYDAVRHPRLRDVDRRRAVG